MCYSVSMMRDEVVNSVTHLVGALLAVGATAVLIVFASLRGSAWHIVSFSIFGAALIFLYSASSAYHCAVSERWRRRLQRLDHAMIFVLIAGTYTPVMLGVLRGGWGWSIFGVVWGIALAGIFWKLFARRITGKVSMVLYLLMGWVALVAIVPLVEVLSGAALLWLFLGGALYTLGALALAAPRAFLARAALTPHNLFHLLVILGSTSHFFMVIRLLP